MVDSAIEKGQSTSAGNTWASPPEPINQILDAPQFPTTLISSRHKRLIELEPLPMPSIALLAQPEIAVAGLRINPQTHAPVHYRFYQGIRIKDIATGGDRLISLPKAPIGFVRFSPDGSKLAMTLTQATGLELWVVDLETGNPQRLTEPVLNATYGAPYRWSHQDLICKFVPADRPAPPCKSDVPTGAIVQENFGRKTPSRTFTNLLQEPHDEALFEYYLTSTLERVTLDGAQTRLVDCALIGEARPSPHGNFILLSTIHRPYSYQLPVSYFPKRTEVLDRAGRAVYEVADLPLADTLSTKFDAVRVGRRNIFWRSDRPATIHWVEALDDGDPAQDVPDRDALYSLDAPFTDAPTSLWRSQHRFSRVRWGREDVALVSEQWYDTRQTRLWRINPAQPDAAPHLLVDRSWEDQYSDPGVPLTMPGVFDRQVLRFTPDGSGLFFSGRGASPQGVYPFLDRLDLNTAQTQRLWQCQPASYETILDLWDESAAQLVTVKQSQIEPPNCFLIAPDYSQRIALTDRSDPAPQLAGIYKEVVQYQRADGVQLSATLYLPPGYDAARDGRLPTVFWIYPSEFKNRDLAGQITRAEHTFSRPQGASVLFLLTQGYAVLHNPSLPIIGEGDAEPNDTYVEQLLAGIEAAVEFVVNRGVADRQRLGIGGHSYGGFTTANVLAHSRLFQAGIALSGAYNRSLTPFGFQGEQRNFWEAPETYTQMSPFTHAAKIVAPLLLVHGGSDSNAGTYPLQTERLYEALKGLGATVRYVVLPLEDHGYRSREAVGHVLWEMVSWFDRHLKGDA